MPLLSVPKLYDDGFECVINQDKVICKKDGDIVLPADQNKCNSILNMTIQENQDSIPTDAPIKSSNRTKIARSNTANSVYTQQNATKLQQCHHNSLPAPPHTALIKTIKIINLWVFQFSLLKLYLQTPTKVHSDYNGPHEVDTPRYLLNQEKTH